ncbi:MAG: DUF357 domain-containing protein [Candidatus Woesearchaeota archaeon]
MPEIEERLRKEINKWLPKAEEEFKKIKDCQDKEFVTNIEAYIKDAYHFLEKEDLVLAFECVIWSWAWMDIGKRKGILK